jgi:PAS domain S-box-containing protein
MLEKHTEGDNGVAEADEFGNSFAVFDGERRLVDWDEGFAREWSFAFPQLKPGIRYAELLAAALAHPGAGRFLQENFGTDDVAAIMEARMSGLGGARSRQYRTPAGRILIVDEQPTGMGGLRRIARDMTEQIQAEDALTAARHRLQAADLESDGIRVELRRNPDGTYFMPPVPEGLRRLLDLPRETTSMDPMLVHTRMRASPEEDARFAEMIERSARTLEIFTLEYGVRDGKGRPRWLRQSMLPRRENDGAVIFSGVIRDVTREREAEDQVELMRSVVVRSSDSIVIFETKPPPARENKILYVNPKFEEVFGSVSRDIVGHPAQVLQVDAMSRASSRQLADALARGDGAPLEFEARGRGGRLLWVEARVETVQKFDDGTFRWVVISRDVSERKRAQMELLRAKEAAEAGNRAKSNFLANMSHELRTPLNAIIGFTELIQSGIERQGWTQSYTEYLADIQSSGRHLLALINTILDLSKIEAGSLALEVGPVDLRDVVKRSLEVVSGLAESGGVAIKADTPDECPPVEGDFLKLKQVLINILSNAVKFTPPGGRVGVGIGWDGGAATITVTDTGCGIAAGDLERVLLPFVQVDNKLSRRFPGSGLGLTIAREFCLLHGGDLRIESAEGQGTTVRIVLPRAQPPGGGVG